MSYVEAVSRGGMLQEGGAASYKFGALGVGLARVDIGQVVVLCGRADARALEAHGGVLLVGHGDDVRSVLALGWGDEDGRTEGDLWGRAQLRAHAGAIYTCMLSIRACAPSTSLDSNKSDIARVALAGLGTPWGGWMGLEEWILLGSGLALGWLFTWTHTKGVQAWLGIAVQKELFPVSVAPEEWVYWPPCNVARPL